LIDAAAGAGSANDPRRGFFGLGALARGPRRGILRSIPDFVFGYGFFVSYAWKDGGVYTEKTCKTLQDRGFEVFLDHQITRAETTGRS
jgi:hypothetical protein